jgi:hypothetical protein
MPATLEALRLLATPDTLVLLFAPPAAATPHGTQRQEMTALAKQVEAGGGRIDGLLSCNHDEEAACPCWGAYPGAFWAAGTQFSIHLNGCYVLGDAARDVDMAYAAGARPIMVLGSRTIRQVLGPLPAHQDFPVAADLATAVSYIGVEEDIARQVGQLRSPTPVVPPDHILEANVATLGHVEAISPLAQGRLIRLRETRAQLRDIVRWLTFFVLGAVGLSLGIAYMLTHLYRMQPFPEIAYYVTLQFISRPLRGALFIAWGVGVILLALVSFYRAALRSRWPWPGLGLGQKGKNSKEN